jgi:chaperonin GroES
MIRPVGNRVVVKDHVESNITEGGIALPDSALEVPQKGDVISVSSDCQLELDEHDVVIFKQFAGTTVESDGKKVRILRAEDVLAVE